MKKMIMIMIMLVLVLLMGCGGTDDTLKNYNYDENIPEGQACILMVITIQEAKPMGKGLVAPLVLEDFQITIMAEDFDEPIVKNLEVSEDSLAQVYIPASDGFSRCVAVTSGSNYGVAFSSETKCLFARSQEVLSWSVVMRPFSAGQ